MIVLVGPGRTSPCCSPPSPSRREHLWDAIHNLEAVVRDLGLADLTRQIAALEGYPTAPT